jgi:hypothetical protein
MVETRIGPEERETAIGVPPSAEFCGRALGETPENSACGAHPSAPFLRLNMIRKADVGFLEKSCSTKHLGRDNIVL